MNIKKNDFGLYNKQLLGNIGFVLNFKFDN